MALTQDLLAPVAGDNPSGVNLRYDPVYDKIKEARRQEEDLAQGIWARDVKKADYAQVIKLASDALAKRSKDLQVAAWLTEALAYEKGFAGLREGLELLRGLIDQFWDTVHPELEDGDPFMRTGVLDWVGSHLEDPIKRAPLTARGYDWFDYKESRRIGYEADCADDSDKLEARNAAIQEGKIPAEQFDEDFNITPKQFYTDLRAEIEVCTEALRSLESLTDEKFTEEPPSFSGIRSALEEVHQTVHMLLARKREQEPDVAVAEPEPEAEPEAAPEDETAYGYEQQPVAPKAAPKAAPKPKAALAAEPIDRDDAIGRIVRSAAYLRGQEPYSPVPYLVVRALRWGELRAVAAVDPSLLEAPPSEIRQQLKRQALDGQWEDVLRTAETAMGLPCGRGWLDLQRYVVRACQELGSWYDPISRSVTAEVRCLLSDFPDLPEATMLDDTPAANRETLEWLKEIAPSGAQPQPAPVEYPPQEFQGSEELRENEPPDANEMAKEALTRGRPDEAMSILAREISQVKNGRERFQRRVQLSQICLSAGKPLIAFPILQDLSAEIEKRRLEEWESSEALAHPLVLLYRCMSMLDRSAEEKRPVYERICRLDPVQAMACD